MMPPDDPIIIACQFGAIAVVYGVLWLFRRSRLRRWIGVQLAIWRGRSIQDRDQPHRPRYPRWAWHWSRIWWEAGFRYAPRGEGPNAVWTKRIGLFIDWRNVRRWLGIAERRPRWNPALDPRPRHWNCRCVLLPVTLPESFPRRNDPETAWGRTSFACARSATPSQCTRCRFSSVCDYRRN